MSLRLLLLALAGAAALPTQPPTAEVHTRSNVVLPESTVTTTLPTTALPRADSHYSVLRVMRLSTPPAPNTTVTTTTPHDRPTSPSPSTSTTRATTTTATTTTAASDRFPAGRRGSARFDDVDGGIEWGEPDWGEPGWARPRLALPAVPSDELRRMRSDFCREEPQDDDGGYRVPDGDYNPRYEAVPGLGYYRFHPRPRTWHAAREVCEREGGYLVVLNSRQEADAVKAMHERCKRILDSHFNSYQYVGVHDQYDEGYWETVRGQPLAATGYEAWMMNQPDNAHHAGENCLSMNRFGYYNDVPCWVELPFTCEHK